MTVGRRRLRHLRLLHRTVWLCTALASSTACARTLHVPADHATVAGALGASAAGDTVAVAPGTYAERVLLPPGRVLRADGPPESVILDGGGDGSVVICDAPTPGTVLEGLVLRGGAGEADGAIRVGGGLLVRGGALAVLTTRIEGCHADIGGGLFTDGAVVTWGGGALAGNSAAFGGGWYARGGSLRLTGVEIGGNSATAAGGGGYGTGLVPFEMGGGSCHDNSAAGDGGAVYLTASGGAIHECRLTGNVAARGGGVFAGPSSLVTVSYSVLHDNRAAVEGGALYVECSGPGGGVCSEIRLFHADVIANRAARSGAGLASGAARIEAEASVVVANQGGLGCLSPQSEIAIACSAVYANGGGTPSEACVPSYVDTLEADPRLCDLAAGVLERCANSPLLAPAACGLPFLGALGEACSPCGLTRALRVTWGGLKARYR